MHTITLVMKTFQISMKHIYHVTSKDCEQIEAISIKEEVEEDLIAKSVVVDISNQITTVAKAKIT